MARVPLGLFGILPKAEAALTPSPHSALRIEGRRTEVGRRCSASVNLYACIPPFGAPSPTPRYHPRDNCTRQDRGCRVTEFLSRSVFWDYIKYATVLTTDSVLCVTTFFEAIDFKGGNIYIYMYENVDREVFIIKRYGERDICLASSFFKIIPNREGFNNRDERLIIFYFT